MLGLAVQHGKFIRAHQSQTSVLLENLLLLLTCCKSLACRLLLLLLLLLGLLVLMERLPIVVERVVLLPVAGDGDALGLRLLLSSIALSIAIHIGSRSDANITGRVVALKDGL